MLVQLNKGCPEACLSHRGLVVALLEACTTIQLSKLFGITKKSDNRGIKKIGGKWVCKSQVTKNHI